MDIGTKREPGREIKSSDLPDIAGGYQMPQDPSGIPQQQDDPFGDGATMPPADYSTP